MQYQYDSGGNIAQITDGTRNEITNYQYDPLDRLTTATATQNGGLVYSRSWSYDLVGNITNLGVLTTGSSALTSSSVGSASLGTSRGRITAFSGGNAFASFTKGALGVPMSAANGGRSSVTGSSMVVPTPPPGGFAPHHLGGKLYKLALDASGLMADLNNAQPSHSNVASDSNSVSPD